MDAFLASVPAGTVEKWFEYYKLEPWGDDWDRSSMIASQITNTISALAAGFAGSKEEPHQIPFDAFVPYREHRDSEMDQLKQSLADLERLRWRRG